MRRLALLLALAASPLRGQPAGRATPPPLGPPPKVALPPIHERHLDNGLRILVVERHEIPLVDAVLVIGTGPEADPPGKSGVASLVAEMLTRHADAIRDGHRGAKRDPGCVSRRGRIVGPFGRVPACSNRDRR